MEVLVQWDPFEPPLVGWVALRSTAGTPSPEGGVIPCLFLVYQYRVEVRLRLL